MKRIKWDANLEADEGYIEADDNASEAEIEEMIREAAWVYVSWDIDDSEESEVGDE